MLKILVPMVLGILLYDQYFRSINWTILWILLGLGIAALSLCLAKSSQHRFAQKSAVGLSLALLTLLGIAVAASKDYGLNKVNYSVCTKSQSSIAVIEESPVEKEKFTRYKIRLVAFNNYKETVSTSAKALLYILRTDSAKALRKGDKILMPSKWKAIRNQGNPFERNYQQYCLRNQIFYQQLVTQKEVVIIGNHRSNLLEKIHEYCMATLEQQIKEPQARALLKAMILGNEKEIDPYVRQAYSDTGVIHIVSISGAHVALLFFAVNGIFRLGRLRQYRVAQLVLSLVCIWFYVLLAGASTPALRAAIMFSITALGNLSEQRNNQLNYLLSAAFILLIIQPMWLFDIGFQLSFAAVLSLILFHQRIVQMMPSKHLVLQWLASAVAASIAAEILIAPLVIYYFNSFPIMFVLANLLASLLMTILLAGGMLLLVLSPISILSKSISWVIVWLSQIFHSGIQVLQSLGSDSFRTVFLTPYALILIYISFFCFAYSWTYKKKQGLWLGLSSLLLLSFAHLKRSMAIAQQERLVVYAQNRTPNCELIRGAQYYTIVGDTLLDYSRKKAHIGWACNATKPIKQQRIFLIADKKILVLDSMTHTDTPFFIDILVVVPRGSHKPKNISAYIEQYKPKTVVIACPQESRELAIWRNLCTAQKIHLHNCATNGAFVFPQ